jgi:poly(hydroxyalkanoate) depolymerase family esterase
MMKSRLLDAMGNTLTLVKKSNMVEATALLRRTLGGDAVAAPAERGPRRAPHFLEVDRAERTRAATASTAGEAKGQPESPTPRSPDFAFAPAGRAPLGELVRALRAGRAHASRTPFAPDERHAYPPDDKFTARSYRGPAGSLNYRLYVPSDHATRELALVLMLHGCTQNPEDFALGTQMNALADEFGLVVAYPHQPRAANSSGCWNWFDKRHQHRGAGEPAKLAGLAQSLASEFAIPKERTFVAGLSAGGAMAEVLAATYPDLFDAVGIHSGLPYKAAKDVPSAFAAMKGAAAEPALRVVGETQCRKIVFHGGADATVDPVNAMRILEQARSGRMNLKQVDLEWRIEGRRVNQTALQDPAGQPVVELWSVEGGGHAWFGGDSRGSYTQSVGVDASRVMVRFFLKQ